MQGAAQQQPAGRRGSPAADKTETCCGPTHRLCLSSGPQIEAARSQGEGRRCKGEGRTAGSAARRQGSQQAPACGGSEDLHREADHTAAGSASLWPTGTLPACCLATIVQVGMSPGCHTCATSSACVLSGTEPDFLANPQVQLLPKASDEVLQEPSAARIMRLYSNPAALVFASSHILATACAVTGEAHLMRLPQARCRAARQHVGFRDSTHMSGVPRC
jgi:hypothetical protein